MWVPLIVMFLTAVSSCNTATLLYAVFFADFGEKEHVFMPVSQRAETSRQMEGVHQAVPVLTVIRHKARRWLDAQKAAFFSLSAAERKMAGVVDQSDLTEVQSDR